MFDASKFTKVQSLIAERHDEIVEAICSLVEIESPSGDVPGSQAVNDSLERVVREIRTVTSAERIPAPDCGEHLLIRAFGSAGNGNQATLILGHTDTVHPRGTLHAQHGVRNDGIRLYGPGVFDMKASCVMALEALRSLTTAGVTPKCPVTLLLTCDEEIGSETGRGLVEREARQAAQVLVLEPPCPGGCVKTERKGVGMWTVTAEGIASHAGLEPKKGASAILELARQTERLHSLSDSDRGTNFNVGVIHGGTRRNVIAAHAEIEVDTRFSTYDEARRVEELMRSLQPFDRRVSLMIEGGINRGPLERTAGVVTLLNQARKLAAGLGFELGECSAGGASDGNFAAALNVPVLDGLGIDGDGAHAVHEHILLSDITPRTSLLAGLLATL